MGQQEKREACPARCRVKDVLAGSQRRRSQSNTNRETMIMHGAVAVHHSSWAKGVARRGDEVVLKHLSPSTTLLFLWLCDRKSCCASACGMLSMLHTTSRTNLHSNMCASSLRVLRRPRWSGRHRHRHYRCHSQLGLFNLV